MRAKLALAAVALISAGCATSITTKHQAAPGTVAVVALPQEPEFAFDGINRGDMALWGLLCFSYVLEVFAGRQANAERLVACAALVGVMAAMPPSEDELKAAGARVRKSAGAQRLQDALRIEVETVIRESGIAVAGVSAEQSARAAQSRDYRSLSALGIERVVETAVVRAGTRGLGAATPPGMLSDPPLFPYLHARVRLVRTADNAELFAREYQYQGARRRHSEWVARADEILDEFRAGYSALAARIADSTFLVYPFGDQNSAIARVMGHGLSSKRRVPGDSLHPTLEWERFPREGDLKWEPDEMARVRNVTYDLVIAEAELGGPAAIVYRREGISDTVHRLDTPLVAGASYIWSVRARFELDGRKRVTEWTAIGQQSSSPDLAPPAFGYRFTIQPAK